ncbi:MAG TPA: hypothetical protein DEQ38_02525 [Elusimicrobia bacterium]|nr:MAG: hypothetical protein A2089_10675 [Elusimicrobia bacterium GWD2_63_28]HCC46983.1 hypothetical protein [Elusimicrobiota bacterium]
MLQCYRSVFPGVLLSFAVSASLFAAGQAASPVNFLYTGSDDLGRIRKIIERADIAGVQIVYNWKDLETGKDKYDFAQIEKDLAFLGRLNKKLFMQVQDRFFRPEARNVPRYLLEEPQYGGGLAAQVDNPGEGLPAGSGWVAQHWNPEVRLRYQKLLQALGKQFDGRVYGVNLPETSADIDIKRDKTGFTCDKYFSAELENLKAAKGAFKKSYVVQYVNFWPCEWENDHNYMGRLFEFAAKNGAGLGGPDIVPGKKAQMKNSYPFFNRYKGKLRLVAMAVQEPTLTYTNPKTKKPFTKEEFRDFARNYLGADIIFWSVTAPWLAR